MTEGRRAEGSHRCSQPSAVGVSVREGSRELRNWLTVVIEAELVRRGPPAVLEVRCVS